MRLTRDTKLVYMGFHGRMSHCWLRIWEQRGKPPVVIVTEMEDNPGASITNRSEHIAIQVYRLLERPEGSIVFIEHYRDRALIAGRPLFKEHFDRVTFDLTEAHEFINPQWRRVTKAEVEALIGQPFPL